jgi:hypothetical protein
MRTQVMPPKQPEQANSPAPDSRAFTRRTLMKRGLAAGAATVAGALAATEAAEGQSAGNPAPPVDPDAITPNDIAVADKVAGRRYTPNQRAQMARTLGSTRDNLIALRGAAADPASTLGAPALYFDPRLPGMSLPKGKSSVALSRAPLPAYAGEPEILAFASVADLSRLVRARKVSSTTLTRMYLDRLKRYGLRLLCIVTLTEELALAQAARADDQIKRGRYRGPLYGIPYGAKDLLATRGIRTTYGAPPYENQVLDYDATVVERLREAGAVLLAKLTSASSPWVTCGSAGARATRGSPRAARPDRRRVGQRDGGRSGRLRHRDRNAGQHRQPQRRERRHRACARPLAACRARVRWRFRGRWTRSARCAAASRIVR